MSAGLLSLGLLAALTPTSVQQAQAAVADTSRFVPLAPNRILDTRPTEPGGADGPKGIVGAGQQITLQVTGRGGVAATATAVALNVTATGALAPGFVTVWPTGKARPEASNLNVERGGQTIANLVVVQLGTGGAVDLYSQTGTHLVADVAGYWEPASASRDGRLTPTVPTRVLDTRNGTGLTSAHKVDAGTYVTVSLNDAVGLGWSAAVLNITATESDDAGFVTAWPSDAVRPEASNLNLERANQTIPNLAIVRLSSSGTINLFAQRGTQLVADLLGVFTGNSADLTSAGLFVPQAPNRIADSRKPLGFGQLGAGSTATLQVADPASGLGTALVNVTATEATNKGYVTVWPSGRPQPPSSNLNIDQPGQTIPNLVISGLGPTGALDMFSQSGTQLVVDLAGLFTTSAIIQPVPPTPIDQPPPPNSTPDRFKIFVIYPSDAARNADLEAGVKNETGLLQSWVADPLRAEGRKFRIVGTGTTADINVRILAYPNSQLEPNRLFNEVVAKGTAELQPYEIAVFWVVGSYGSSCSGNIPRAATFIWIKGCSPALTPDKNAPSFLANDSARIALHEMLHTLGVVPSCATNSDGSHHLNTSAPKDDFFYENSDRISISDTTKFDPTHVNYYGHNIKGCYDLKTDPIWVPA